MCFWNTDFASGRLPVFKQLQGVSFWGFWNTLGQSAYVDFEARRRAEDLCRNALGDLAVILKNDARESI